MKIDIDNLTEAELVDLNNRIIQRLRFLQQMRAHTSMLEFSLGERVCFQPDGRPLILGVITRYNKKTVTVITDGGEHWNVAPSVFAQGNHRSYTGGVQQCCTVSEEVSAGGSAQQSHPRDV